MNTVGEFFSRNVPSATEEGFPGIGLHFKEKSPNHFKVTIDGLACGRMWTEAQGDVESLFAATWYYAPVGVSDGGAHEGLSAAIEAAFALATAFRASRETPKAGS